MRRLLAALILYSAAAQAGTLTLKPLASSDGPNILLKDVVEGPLDAVLGLTVLKPLGRPGSLSRVNADLVQAKLRRSPGGPWQVAGTACDVSATSQVVKGADVASFATQYLQGQLAGLSKEARVDISIPQAPADMTLSGAPVALKVDASARELRGDVILRVRLLQNGQRGDEREAASMLVSFKVRVSRPVLVAARSLRKGELVDASALSLTEKDVTYEPGEPLAIAGDAEGKRTVKPVPLGKVLLKAMLEQPPLIRRGDIVKLVSRSGAVNVEVPAKALRDAALGESLPVEIEGTKKTVQARCLDSGTVLKDGF